MANEFNKKFFENRYRVANPSVQVLTIKVMGTNFTIASIYHSL